MMLSALLGFASTSFRQERATYLKAEIARLVGEGKTYSEIGNSLGLCQKTIQGYCRVLRISPPRAKHVPAAISDRNIKVIKMALDGIPMSVIGEQLGVSRERIRQIVKKSGATGRSLAKAARLKRVRHLQDMGLSAAAIARAVRVEERAVREMLSEAALTPNIDVPKFNRQSTRTYIEIAMNNGKLTGPELAAKCGVSPNWIGPFAARVRSLGFPVSIKDGRTANKRLSVVEK